MMNIVITKVVVLVLLLGWVLLQNKKERRNYDNY
jgi:preprotein translocase subunit SecG